MTEYAPATTGEYLSDVLQFSKDFVCREKYLKDDKHSNFHFAQKFAWIFVLGHYPFLEAHSFLRTSSSKKTVRFSEQILSADKYTSIFLRQMEGIIYLCKVLTTARLN